MNQEAIEWLEGLDEGEHDDWFTPVNRTAKGFFSLKTDTKNCVVCNEIDDPFLKWG